MKGIQELVNVSAKGPIAESMGEQKESADSAKGMSFLETLRNTKEQPKAHTDEEKTKLEQEIVTEGIAMGSVLHANLPQTTSDSPVQGPGSAGSESLSPSQSVSQKANTTMQTAIASGAEQGLLENVKGSERQLVDSLHSGSGMPWSAQWVLGPNLKQEILNPGDAQQAVDPELVRQFLEMQKNISTKSSIKTALPEGVKESTSTLMKGDQRLIQEGGGAVELAAFVAEMEKNSQLNKGTQPRNKREAELVSSAAVLGADDVALGSPVTKVAVPRLISGSEYLTLQQPKIQEGLESTGLKTNFKSPKALMAHSDKSGEFSTQALGEMSPVAVPVFSKVTEAQAGPMKPALRMDMTDPKSDIAQMISTRVGRPGTEEMRIRLAPDHLGELSIKVSTRGSKVSLVVEASNHSAKEMIESSISSLREHLAAQNLSLASVDVAVSKDSGNTNLSSLNFALNDNNSNASTMDSRSGGQGRNGESYSRGFEESERALGKQSASAMKQRIDGGRIDLIA